MPPIKSRSTVTKLEGIEQLQAHTWIPGEKIGSELFYGNAILGVIPKKGILPLYKRGVQFGRLFLDHSMTMPMRDPAKVLDQIPHLANQKKIPLML